MAASRRKPRRAPVRAAAQPKAPPRPGRQPTQPLVVLYREGTKTVCAMLVHPQRSDTKIVTSTGPYAALGVLQDLGYAFGRTRETVPDWAAARVPQECALIGCANITSVPFV